ncbi:hypothetical protein [Ahrensia marina]|jgi:hypothetical protein|uniref:Uncharacterized protein n=2 Tax=Ahrensia marina TaxID=1514904 RepID=A0A0M9GL40_9HYPH|nr:hypothetical protein [Ahrensia marina]KPA99955.1 hypothetical protein SU32_16395 [Ahrensia marina]KPB00102.1 hypothetical protein SU32_15420 [Ahrensia marina]
MKTLALTLAATLIASTSAFAANSSFSNGDGSYLQNGGNLDMEATASIGTAAAIDTNHIFTVDEVVHGRDAKVKFTLNADGSRNIISESFRSSDR